MVKDMNDDMDNTNNKREEIFEAYRPLVDALLDKHALEVTVHDLSEASGFTEAFIIAIARSDLHARTLRDTAEEFLDKDHIPYKVEGEGSTRWTLMDAGHLVVNILSREGSDYYRLDSLWGDAPSKKYDNPEE